MTIEELRRDLPEAAFTTQVVELARLHGWLVYHALPGRTASGWRTPTQGDIGFPDIVAVRGEEVIVAELKRHGAYPSLGQRSWLEAWRRVEALFKSPISVFVWRPQDWPEIESILGGKL